MSYDFPGTLDLSHPSCAPGISGCYVLSSQKATVSDGSKACNGGSALRPIDFDFKAMVAYLRDRDTEGLWLGLEEKEPHKYWYWQSTLTFDCKLGKGKDIHIYCAFGKTIQGGNL